MNANNYLKRLDSLFLLINPNMYDDDDGDNDDDDNVSGASKLASKMQTLVPFFFSSSGCWYISAASTLLNVVSLLTFSLHF